MARPIVAWSYSVLTMFENCPRKYWAVKIKKIDDTNKWNSKGDAEHLAIEDFLKRGMALPSRMEGLAPIFERVRAAPGEQYIEYKMALKQDFTPTHGTDWDNVWVRVNADYIKVNGDKAVYLDWKSGKKRDGEDQINLTALSIFRHFPQVQQVNGGLLYYAHNALSPHIVHRRDESLLWNGFISRVRVLEEAIRDSNFPETPNGLCGYCPYRACPHNTVAQREAREAAKNGN